MRIQPQNIIVPGCGIRTAHQLIVTSDGDDLRTAADLRVALLDADGVELVFTHIRLSGDQYAKWDSYAPDYFTGAHRICASALGLTLI